LAARANDAVGRWLVSEVLQQSPTAALDGVLPVEDGKHEHDTSEGPAYDLDGGAEGAG